MNIYIEKSIFLLELLILYISILMEKGNVVWKTGISI